MAVREAEPVGSLQEVHDVGLDREALFGSYRSMLAAGGNGERDGAATAGTGIGDRVDRHGVDRAGEHLHVVDLDDGARREVTSRDKGGRRRRGRWVHGSEHTPHDDTGEKRGERKPFTIAICPVRGISFSVTGSPAASSSTARRPLFGLHTRA